MLDSFGRVVPDDAMIIRATEVGDFRNCRRKWFFQSHNGLNLEPIRKNKNLSFGSAWHAALEFYYLHAIGTPNAIEDTQAVLANYLYAEKAKIANELSHLVDQERYALELHAINTQTEEHVELGMALIEGYIPWASGTEPADLDMEVKHVERRLLVPLTPEYVENAYLAAKVDAVVVFNTGIYRGSRWLMEHKTASKSSRIHIGDHLPLDLQVGLQTLTESIYCNALGQPMPMGTVYNLTRKQPPSARVKNPIYYRHPIMRSARELNILYDQLLLDVKHMARASKNVAECYPNPFGLSQFCSWGCQFRNVCEAMNRGEDFEFLLQDRFKQRERNIFETLEDEMEGDDSDDA